MATAYISLVLSESDVDTANNTSKVTAKLYYHGNGVSWSNNKKAFKITIDGTTYSGKDTFTTSTSAQLLSTKSKTVTHNSDGKKTVSVSASFATGVSIGTLTTSKNITLTTIPRASTLTLANGTLGTAQTLTINRVASGLTHKIKYACGDVSGYILGSSSATSSSTSVSWTPPLSLAEQNTKGTSVSIAFTLYTFNSNGASTGSKSYTKTMSIPASVKPSLSISVSDATNHSTTYGGYVQRKSNIKVVPTPTISYGSEITSYQYTIAGKTYSGSEVTTDVITTSGTVSVYCKVTDGRGRIAEATQDITILPYEAPSLVISKVYRSNVDGTANSNGAYLTVVYNASISSLNSLNKATVTIKRKRLSDIEYTSATLANAVADYSALGAIYTFSAETASSYDIEMSIVDNFNIPVSKTAIGSSCTHTFSALAGGLGFAFGKSAEKANALESAWDIYDKFDTLIGNGLAVYDSSSQIDPDTTNEHLILTNSNTPMGSGCYMYIMTLFDGNKSSNRSQLAVPYNQVGSVYHRYYADGVWSSWRRHTNEMVGEIKMWAGDEIPDGWLLCDGSEVSIEEYPYLFKAIRNSWGVPNSSSNFKLPDFTGRVPVGYASSDTDFNTVGKTGGEKTHKLTITEMPSHNHSMGNLWSNGPNGSDAKYMTSSKRKTMTRYTEYTGGGGAHNNLQPYAVIKYIICAI